MMENVWEKLKSLKGRSWNETKDILNKLSKDIHPVEEIVKTYTVNSETLPEEDREIYGIFPKAEPFYLERCKVCSHLLKPSVLNYHFDVQHKRSPNSSVKKSLFISPSKKRNGKKGSKSTSEDDSESVVSSETPSPAVDLQETQSSDSNVGLMRDDSIVDVISVDEFASEESKPPTPGPQDLYEEFAVPYTEEVQVLPSVLEKNENTKSIYTTSKSGLRMKITSNKDPNSKTQSTTSLLEAHLLSNTKYSTAAHSNNDSKNRNGNYKYGFTQSGGDQGTEKGEETVDQTDSWKAPLNQSQNAGAAKLKTETKISIPISVLPQNVKIISSLKKVNSGKSIQLLKSAAQKPISTLDAKEKINNQPSSPYSLEINDNAAELPPLEVCKEKSKSKRNKRSKGKNRSSKNVEFDPDKHCGVLIDENRHCMRSLTCKTHAVALRRAVEGRSKEFDKLLAEHRASKEALREQERSQNLLLPEPTVSIPLLSVDKISGNTIQIPSANSEPEIIKIRVPNIITNPEMIRSCENFEVSENENQVPEVEAEKQPKKIVSSIKPSTVLNVKSTNSVSQMASNTVSATKNELKPQLYENDVKISFVCSDMLYKVGGLLYTDRSRQAIRKCMESLISQKAKGLPKRGTIKPKITDFLQLVKNCNNPPVRLSLFKEENSENMPAFVKSESVSSPKNEVKLKTYEELERMKSVLAHSSQILKNLSSDENELNKLKISRKLKRKSDRIRMACSKKIKHESLSDENYDINTLLSFDKPLTNKDGVDELTHFPVITTSDGYTFNTIQNNPTTYEVPIKNDENQLNEGLPNISNMMGNISYNVYLNGENVSNAPGYTESDTAQLLQTFKDLENEICNTVGNNMPELYPSQSLQNNSNNVYVNYITNPSNEVGATNGVEFKENCENDYKVIDTNITTLEETISKNYSLIEEYCKNISTEELLLDNKTDFEFYDSGRSVNNVKLNKNEVIVVNDNMFVDEKQDGSVPGATVDGLNFDTQLLNSYLSSISNESSNPHGTEMNFGTTQQYEMAPMDVQEQSMSKEHVYEEILTLNKQFQDNTAVNMEKPPTPSPVYTEAENDRSFKWLF